MRFFSILISEVWSFILIKVFIWFLFFSFSRYLILRIAVIRLNLLWQLCLQRDLLPNLNQGMRMSWAWSHKALSEWTLSRWQLGPQKDLILKTIKCHFTTMLRWTRTLRVTTLIADDVIRTHPQRFPELINSSVSVVSFPWRQ